MTTLGVTPSQTNDTELYGVQMLRALAALAVVTHHSLEVSNGAAGHFSPDWLTTSGAAGVDIFFIISGFIMLHVSFRPHRPPPAVGSFLFRRVTRIYPLYWLCCFAMLAASAAGFLRGQHWSGTDVATSLLLLPGNHLLINVSWTLVYELYFYLIFAVALIARSMAVAVSGPIVAIISLWLASDVVPWQAVRSLLADPVPLEFCMGLCLAWAYSRWQAVFKQLTIGWVLALVGLGITAAAPLFVWHPDTTGLPGAARVVAWGLPALLVMVAALPIRAPRKLATRFAVLLGDASYALYLTHLFVMIGYGWVLKSTGFGASAQIWVVPLVVVASIMIAIVTHLTIERPLLSIIRTLTTRSSSRVVTP
jgi:exopolysaccharide production protein ExoZ